MNSTLTCDSPIAAPAAPAAPGFYERLVLLSLKPFVHGGMRMVYPDGSTRIFGAPGAQITAEMRIRSLDFFKRCALFGNVGFRVIEANIKEVLRDPNQDRASWC